jgi:peptidoglycan-N-acetylglucosamine deacetylase
MLPEILGAVAAAGVCSWAGYNCYSPSSQLYGRTIADGENPREIALTYDDGPNDPHTWRLLEVLAKHGVRATFFLIGQFVKARPEIARAVSAAGHAIGNHTFTHPNLAFCSAQRVERELKDCHIAIADTLGMAPAYFRPPYGARRPVVLRMARSLNYTPVMWNVICFDWLTNSPDKVEAHAIKGIAKHRERGKLVVLHDGGHRAMGTDRGHTVAATERLLARYKNEGYRFVTVRDMESPKS